MLFMLSLSRQVYQDRKKNGSKSKYQDYIHKVKDSLQEYFRGDRFFSSPLPSFWIRIYLDIKTATKKYGASEKKNH